MKKHKIARVLPGSIAEEMEIKVGDFLISINDQEMDDIFDYQYLAQDDYLEVLIEKPDGDQWLLEIDKDPDEDLGIEFDNVEILNKIASEIFQQKAVDGFQSPNTFVGALGSIIHILRFC